MAHHMLMLRDVMRYKLLLDYSMFLPGAVARAVPTQLSSHNVGRTVP